MAPEQCRGIPSDGRADLYSLGVIWFELLTGRLPIDGRNVFQLMTNKLGTRAPGAVDLDPCVPDGVSRVVAKLLELDPGNRYPTAEFVLRELEEIRAGRPPILDTARILTGLLADRSHADGKERLDESLFFWGMLTDYLDKITLTRQPG